MPDLVGLCMQRAQQFWMRMTKRSHRNIAAQVDILASLNMPNAGRARFMRNDRCWRLNARHHVNEGFTRDVASHHATVAQARPAIQPAFSFYRCPELRGHSTIYAPSALKYRGNIAD